MPSNQELKRLRNERNITVREVEHASRRIADVKGDRRVCISNGWLAQLENGASESSIHKLFSLSVIYRVNFLDLIRLYNVNVDEKQKFESVADPYVTQLVVPETNDQWLSSSDHVETRLITDWKLQVPANGNHDRHLIYGHLGLDDLTMYPMIRPGALLRIDTSQNKIVTGAWRNEYERPIFFIELRHAYACGWCELQGNQLLIIPHHSSPASIRRFIYPREAEIVGRVIGYDTGCMNAEAELIKPSRRKVKTVTNSS